MRNALFAILLVAASFAGGAFINSPAMSWVKTALTPPSPSSTSGEKSADTPSVTVDPVPSAPLPLLASQQPTQELPRSRPEASARRDPAVDRAMNPAVSTSSDRLNPSFPEIPAPISELPPIPQAEPQAILIPKPAANSWEDAPGSAPATAAIGGQPSKRGTPVVNIANPRSGDWVTLRKQLAAHGVARYRIEVDLEGKARFSCVIPFPSSKSVGQHFEAESDDEFLAAETVLKRIMLWKASENEADSGPEPKP